MKKIAIIGAGLAGLTVAKRLDQQAHVTLFEKARGVSGRLSTRRAEPFFFDHGAQYFTARTDAFRAFIQPLLDQGVVQRWTPRHVSFDQEQVIARSNWQDEEPRYVGVPAMNSVAKALAADLDVRINTRITALMRTEKWCLSDDNGVQYDDFDWVISTVPAPQASVLLPRSFRHHAAIEASQMRACFSLLLGFSQPLQLDYDAAHISNSDLSWLAVNSHKPGRATPFTLMVHSSTAYAEAHIDDDRDSVLAHLCEQTSRLLGYDVANADYKTVHGWRYASNAVRDAQPVLIDSDLCLGACGDWCEGGRVEGAFSSALRLVDKMQTALL